MNNVSELKPKPRNIVASLSGRVLRALSLPPTATTPSASVCTRSSQLHPPRGSSGRLCLRGYGFRSRNCGSARSASGRVCSLGRGDCSARRSDNRRTPFPRDTPPCNNVAHSETTLLIEGATLEIENRLRQEPVRPICRKRNRVTQREHLRSRPASSEVPRTRRCRR
jgi:hypothetical protein